MAPTAPNGDPADGGELEFFGVKLSVKNPHLATLLNSSVNDDVQVIRRRARDAFAGAGDDARAEREVAERVLNAGDSVCIRVDETEEA
jgi:hypothetical protein